MAEIRFNYGDKFTQTSDSNTGIGSTIPAGKLDVAGGTSAGSLRVSGIASLSSYQGFVNTKFTSTDNSIVEAGQSGSVSGEVVIGTGQTTSVSTGATTGQGGIQSLKVYETFMPPVGGTADRPTDVKPGMVYYNKDFKTIEFWDGNFWKQVDNTTRSGRGIIAGGYTSTQILDIGFIQIMSKGNEDAFGDLTNVRGHSSTAASSTRGLVAGGSIYPAGSTPFSNIIDYVTIQSKGDAIDFGDLLSTNTNGDGGCSSSTRGLFASRYPHQNVIEYVQINTLGNSIDFGDRTVAVAGYPCAVASPTRGVWGGGYLNASPLNSAIVSTIDFVTISSLGNAVKFGDLTKKRGAISGSSSPVRGLYAGGNDWSPGSGSVVNTIDYITIASEGNATDFGTLTIGRAFGSATSTPTRAVFAAGRFNSHPVSDLNRIMDFISMQSGGSAQEFGDLNEPKKEVGMTSDSHGGLGGF